ncbi:MAG TPA: hemerythrin domain-containing protein [Acidimicrobiales bacterium]
MRAVPEAPADTRIMGIVHEALRRDLGRAIGALAASPGPGAERRAAIAGHLAWMMGFLDAHHRGEDAGLWPLVRRREPGSGPLLDAMAADHARIAPCIDACRTAARDLGAGAAGSVSAALGALERLRDVLLPHLRREEDEVLPLVSVALTAGEWRAVDHEQFVAPKSLAELGFEGHWLLDGLDAARARVVVRQVPAIPRLILLLWFGRRYRRRAAACWGPADGGGPASGTGAYRPAPRLPRRIPGSGRVEVVVPVPVGALWRVVSDVTRVGEWSHECRRVEWLDGATRAGPGVRFRGTSKAGPWSWSRVNEVVAADAPHTLVWRTIPTALFPDSTEWRIELSADEGGTRVVQSFRLLRVPPLLGRLFAIAIPAHRDRATGLADDLRRLGEVAGRADRVGEPTR